MSKKFHRGSDLDAQVDQSIIRIPPHHYIHVLDQNTNIARVEIGPLTYIRQDNERSEVNPSITLQNRTKGQQSEQKNRH